MLSTTLPIKRLFRSTSAGDGCCNSLLQNWLVLLSISLVQISTARCYSLLYLWLVLLSTSFGTHIFMIKTTCRYGLLNSCHGILTDLPGAALHFFLEQKSQTACCYSLIYHQWLVLLSHFFWNAYFRMIFTAFCYGLLTNLPGATLNLFWNAYLSRVRKSTLFTHVREL